MILPFEFRHQCSPMKTNTLKVDNNIKLFSSEEDMLENKIASRQVDWSRSIR